MLINLSYTQRIRAILYYVSIFVFFAGLPFLLSNALGYKFDPRTFRFTKTGLLVLKTQPEGAEIILNGNLLNEKTPAILNELLPGIYSVELKLKDHYPWFVKSPVASGMVTSFEKIILFPLRPNIKPLNKQAASWFVVDQDKGVFYYADNETATIFRSDLEGNDVEPVAQLEVLDPAPLAYKLSYDRKMILYFNRHKIGISFLKSLKPAETAAPPLVLEIPRANIYDVFWHSHNNYLLVAVDHAIEVMEIRPDAEPIILVSLNRRDPRFFYDENADILYFYDTAQASDGKSYDNIYKLELKRKLFDFTQPAVLKTEDHE